LHNKKKQKPYFSYEYKFIITKITKLLMLIPQTLIICGNNSHEGILETKSLEGFRECWEERVCVLWKWWEN